MRNYWLRKILAMPVILLAASLLIFWAVRLLPGDPARLMAGMQADQRVGDLGISIRSHKPVVEEIAERFPYTVALATVSYALAVAVGITAGIFAAIYRGRKLDHFVMVAAILGASIANFWLALMAMNFFAVQLAWLPLLGANSWKSYVLPSITLALLPGAVIARMCRASMLEIIHQDYIRTARAKGLSTARVYIHHALRNALIPIITIIGMNFASLLGGAVITETVFNWPGLGRLMVDAVRYRDYATIQGLTLLTVAIVIAVNFAVDVLIGMVDPRIRFD
jgi:glutathione transport system permease protein